MIFCALVLSCKIHSPHEGILNPYICGFVGVGNSGSAAAAAAAAAAGR